MGENLKVSVVIPAYNEGPNIEGTLSEISAFFGDKKYGYEVIVIDDGSDDDTVAKARPFSGKLANFKVIESKPNRGKGYVLHKAMLEACGEYVMFMDADNSTSIYELEKFLPFLDEGYDAVIGSRRLKGSEILTSEPAARIILGQVYILLSKMLIGVTVSDFNCGFKAYRRASARTVYSLQKMNDWSFDTEVIFLLKKNGMRIKEVPVRWAHKYTSKVKPLKAGIESFKSLLRIQMNNIRGIYG